MSLDVYLYSSVTCPHCNKETGLAPQCLFEANITHNLGPMASAAGIYEILWRPDKHEYKTAGDIIVKLRAGILLMENSPNDFRKFDPENGWGSYDDFLPWCKRYLAACKENPKAQIKVSR